MLPSYLFPATTSGPCMYTLHTCSKMRLRRWRADQGWGQAGALRAVCRWWPNMSLMFIFHTFKLCGQDVPLSSPVFQSLILFLSLWFSLSLAPMLPGLMWQSLVGAGMRTTETITALTLPIPGRNSGRGTCKEGAFQAEDNSDPMCFSIGTAQTRSNPLGPSFQKARTSLIGWGVVTGSRWGARSSVEGS